MKIFLAEDKSFIRTSIAGNFRAAGIEVIEFPTGLECWYAYKKNTPDKIITNLNMPLMSGIELIENIRRVNKHIPIYVITGDDDTYTIRNLFRLDVQGVFLKDSEGDVKKLVEAVQFSETLIGPDVAKILSAPFKDNRHLTDREEEYKSLLLRGLSNKEISFQMGISDKTGNTYRKQIKSKLNIKSFMQLARAI